MPSIDFEPLVEFPENPFEAARVYLSLMAYPEKGAGQQAGSGAQFTTALWQYVVWYSRKTRGLAAVRAKFQNLSFEAPRKRDFEGTLNRGLARLARRSAAYSIVGNQMANGLLNGIIRAQEMVRDGQASDAFMRPLGDDKPNPIRGDILAAATPSPHSLVRGDLERWSKGFGLNTTGAPADPTRKAKDLIRRGFIESRPVLHLAHGFNMIISQDAKQFDGWDDCHWLLVLLWNCDAWIWKALDLAIAWRKLGCFPDIGLPTPDQMIELVSPKKCELMHPPRHTDSDT